MIAGCIDRMSRDGCGGCERRDPCRALFGNLFGLGFDAAPASAGSRGRREEPPFLAFLSRVGRALVERPEAASAPAAGGIFARKVEGRIEPLLAAGEARIGRVARELGLSRQTLYRRLKDEGASFEQLVERVRRRLALRLLRDEGVSVKEAAWRLGFADPAAFSRAFKRWTGKSPSEVRPRRS